MTDVCVRSRPGLGPIACLVAGLFIAAVAAPAFAAEPIDVQLDRARIIKLPERATTVVIGDPLIADLSIQPDGLAVITGKGYGATNLIVLDKQGAVLNEQTIQVKGPADPTVVVYRGDTRETYSCTPDCSRRITLGDDPDYFNKTVDETSTRNTQAMAAGDKTGGGSVPGGYTPVNAPGASAGASGGGGITITIGGGGVNPASRH
jgi:Pilus formation protein N terminal region